MEAFRATTEWGFISDTTDHIQANHGEDLGRLPGSWGPCTVESLPREMLERLVAAGIRRARSHGLTWEYSITAFVALMFEVAPNFEEQPKIRGTLNNEAVAPDSRIDL